MTGEWLKRRGGKRALLQSMWTPLQVVTTSAYRFVRQPDAPVRRLVFVCAGNICRSPFAEHLALRAGLPAVSMGLRADPGHLANEAARRHAADFGIDLGGHRARQVSSDRLEDGDLLLGFELWHSKALEPLAADRAASVRLLGGFAGLPKAHIFDPYGLSDASFRFCFARIAEAVEALGDSLRVEPARSPER